MIGNFGRGVLAGFFVLMGAPSGENLHAGTWADGTVYAAGDLVADVLTMLVGVGLFVIALRREWTRPTSSDPAPAGIGSVYGNGRR